MEAEVRHHRIKSERGPRAPRWSATPPPTIEWYDFSSYNLTATAGARACLSAGFFFSSPSSHMLSASLFTRDGPAVQVRHFCIGFLPSSHRRRSSAASMLTTASVAARRNWVVALCPMAVREPLNRSANRSAAELMRRAGRLNALLAPLALVATSLHTGFATSAGLWWAVLRC